jgi:cell division protease FtsH
MTSTLGGRASEEINFGKISTGALNDLERVTKQAYAMVMFYGLNKKVGNISFYDSSGQQEYALTKPYSEKTAETIDQEVHLMIEQAYDRAVQILKDNKEKVDKLANLLLEREVIFREDLELIFGKRTFKRDIENALEDERDKDKMKKRIQQVRDEVAQQEAEAGNAGLIASKSETKTNNKKDATGKV